MERPGALLARRAEEGMEPDDLLCSRNARPQKALVGRAQLRVSYVAPDLKIVGGNRPLIGLSPLGINEGSGSLSKRLL